MIPLLPNLAAKFGVPVAIAFVSFVAGAAFHAQVLDKPCPPMKCPKVEIPPCPDCNCPPSLGSEFEKIKNTRGTINLHLHQNYTTATDSAELRKVFDESIERAFARHSVKKRK